MNDNNLKHNYSAINSEDNDNEVEFPIRERSMSFNSSSMMGVFPSECEVPPPIINGVLFFKKCPPLEQIKKVSSKLNRIERFKRVPRYNSSKGGWVFEEPEKGDNIDDLITKITVASDLELYKEIKRVSAEDLTGYGKLPAWNVRVIENTSAAGNSALVFRIHHVIGDGVSLVGVMEKLFLDEKGNPLKLNIPINDKNKTKKEQPFFLKLLLDVFLSFFKVLYLAISAFDSDVVFTSKNKSKLKMTKTRKIIYFPIVKLDYIKSIKNKANMTVNDVLLAVTSGAIRRYCLGRKDPLLISNNSKETSTASTVNRALIPVAFPRSKEESSDPAKCMRNKWAFVSVEMPLGVTSSEERLEHCNRSMNELKSSPMAYVQLWVQTNILPLLPSFLQQNTALDLFKRHSLVFSNVPGPSAPVYFAGEKLTGIQVVFPNLLPQVLLISYDGGIFMNMVVDDEVVTEGDKLKSYFLQELKELGGKYGLSQKEEDIIKVANLNPDGSLNSSASSVNTCC